MLVTSHGGAAKDDSLCTLPSLHHLGVCHHQCADCTTDVLCRSERMRERDKQTGQNEGEKETEKPMNSLEGLTKAVDLLTNNNV